ncbi:uncharacterized protein DUF885 [Chitinophaga niastensis]|uniref:Uncharacterized protein DUF885 n=1 Tax=Chitinophaga niastensis TaxID=536980 RepID=A0A2P8HJ49_CHINA|nr:DUF885 family protein [Chitinophaga niastensis]PSL46234.1 uncharacterized protein DUF885 [Chitinophaga niastensis]
MSLLKKITPFIACMLLQQAVVSAQSTDNDLYQQTSEVNNIMVQYDADAGNLNRFYFIESSPERFARLTVLVKSYQQRLEQLNYAALNVGAQVDYTLFKRKLAASLTELTTAQKEYDQVKKWFPFADKMYAIEQNRRRGAKPDAAALAGQLSDMAKEVNIVKSKLEKDSSLGLPELRRSIATTKGLRDALGNVFTFYNGYDPLFSWWVPAPYKQLDTLLKSYGAAFEAKEKNSNPRQEDGSGIVGHPIGRDELIKGLQQEMIPYTPEELVAIANKEFAWCDAEMEKATREMGLGTDWKAATEKVKNSYVPPAEQPAAMMQLYNESIDFLKQHNLITLPPLAEETWRMIMMTPERQLVNPFFLGGEEFIVSYPVSTMSHADKMMSMRGNNPHFSRATVHHELLAGHALQEFMQNRYKAYRHFETPFWIEGWALYWERLLWDQGFVKSPEDRIGMLFWRKHRCARIIFSINYHTGKWTPQQCIDFLVDRVGHERANAEGEVRRSFAGGYSPLYQIAYMIGALQFEALKKELVDSGKMSYKQYHDAVLKENMMPVEMLRAILLNKSVPKDFNTNWRFYKL